MSKIGYIRVSTEHQETARQQEIMCDYRVDRIFSEKISGANKDRPQLKAMLDYVREGDTLYIESMDIAVYRFLIHIEKLCVKRDHSVFIHLRNIFVHSQDLRYFNMLIIHSTSVTASRMLMMR